MKKLIPLILFIAILSYGCSNTGQKNDVSNTPSNVETTAEMASTYLKEKGYTIISIDGKVGEDYILTKELLTKLPYQQYWEVQTIKASDYLDKNIQTYKFIVKNHPLDNFKDNEKKQTVLWVMVCENKVIGGYSLPDVDLIGGVYPLNGILN